MPVAVRLVGTGSGEVALEARVETQASTQHDDEIVERAVMLITGRVLTLLDQRTNDVGAGDVFGEKSAEALAWGIEARTVIQSAGQHQEFVERDGH